MADKLSRTFKNDMYGNIYAIGDIHGDIGPLIICLRDCCKVIKKKAGFDFQQNKEDLDLFNEMSKEWNDPTFKEDLNYEWCGKDSIIVFCGDLLDNVRGDIYKKPQEFPFEEARILKFINKINKQAMAVRGRIYKVLGNHDLNNLNGLTKTLYSSYVSQYAKDYEGYKNGAENRLDYFCKGKAGSKLLGEDGAYIFLMINNYIFVHGGISSDLLNYNNIINANESLMKYIYDDTNTVFDADSVETENLLSSSHDGILFDRFFGFKQKDVSEEEMCSKLYGKFTSLCRELKDNYDIVFKEHNINDYFDFHDENVCDPNKMKLIIGHCNQNKLTSDHNQIYRSTFTKIISSDNKNGLNYNEEFGEIVETDSNIVDGIYGITVSCGDKDYTIMSDEEHPINKNYPSIFRIDVGMSRGFNVMDGSPEYLYSRTPQVLKITGYPNPVNITIIKSTYENSLIHLKDWNLNAYKKKYLKYKNKYLSLKNKLN
jgi:hypothetical protein